MGRSRPHRSLWLVVAAVLGPLWAPAASAQDGISIATVVVGKDSPSEQPAMVVGHLARQGFARNPAYAVLDLEGALQGSDEERGVLQKRAEEALERGQAGYDAFELDPALEALAEAVVGYEKAVAGLSDVEPLVEAFTFQGAAFALKGDVDAAREAFQRALVLDEGASLTGGQFPDTVQAIFEEARGDVAGFETGSIAIYAAPAQAEVWVDGSFRGSSPLVVTDLPKGRHYIRVLRDGYAHFGEAVDVPGGGEETVQATLRPVPGLAGFDKLRQKLKGADERAAADLAAKLKVEQLFWAVVEASGDTVTVSGSLTDGVGGGVLHNASKSFTVSSPRFYADVEAWLADQFRRSGTAKAAATGEGVDGDSFMPSKPVDPPTPGTLIAGWVIAPLTIVPVLLMLVSGAAAFYFWDIYYFEAQLLGPLHGQDGVKNQQQAFSDQGRIVFALLGVTAFGADVLGVVSAAVLATGITLIVLGLNEKAEIEDVLARGPWRNDARLAQE